MIVFFSSVYNHRIDLSSGKTDQKLQTVEQSTSLTFHGSFVLTTSMHTLTLSFFRTISNKLFVKSNSEIRPRRAASVEFASISSLNNTAQVGKVDKEQHS